MLGDGITLSISEFSKNFADIVLFYEENQPHSPSARSAGGTGDSQTPSETE